MTAPSPHAKHQLQTLRSLTLCLFVLSLIVAPPGSKAQPEDITAATPATHQQIETWLESGEPRLMAWGAHFAATQNDRAALSSIVPLIARQTVGPSNLATMVLLDALIQRDVIVSANTIAVIASAFPEQAAILAARLPLANSTPLLLDWYGQRGSTTYTILPRIAAMLLSHQPPLGFAASVLSESEETLHISVISKIGPGFGIGTGGSCGGGTRTHLSSWPPVFSYSLGEDFQQPPHLQPAYANLCQPQAAAAEPSAPLLVDAAGDHIRYYRRDFYGPGICGGMSRLTPANRHRLLAQMLSLDDQEIPFPTDSFHAILWHNHAQYLSEATATVAKEEANLNVTLKLLEAKDFITEQESATSRPALHVAITDFRGSTVDPLPPLAFADPRTTLAH